MFMLAVFSSAVYAQNDSNPWSITVGTNAIDLFPVSYTHLRAHET